MTNPTHILVAFDGETENPRRALDEEYKSNRDDYSAMPEEETPFSQLPDVYAALDVLGLCHRETENCEADDWIAGYAKTYGDVMDVVIASQDSDFFQLITDRVTVLRYRGKESLLCDIAYIREKLGVMPQQYAAFKSLTGDSADNIRGVPKIGPKTAAELMNQFGNLENLLKNTHLIRKPSVRESVTQSTERIQKNFSLIRLDSREALPFDLQTLRWQDSGMTTTQVLQQIGLK